MPPPSKLRSIILGGLIGNINEWYNFLLYGYFAAIMAQLFFPQHNKLSSLNLVFLIFAISFMARPFGGIIFGWIGDSFGRRRALIISLFCMAVPSFLMGCLPTYSMLGITSPILLCALRFMQGISTGGEQTGSAIYLAEYAPVEQRSLWVNAVLASTVVGILSGSFAALIIMSCFSQQSLLAWGWRIGYWIGTLFCIISILIRINMPETPHFKNLIKQKKLSHPLKKLFNSSSCVKSLLIVFLLASAYGVYFQIFYIWMPTYLMHLRNFSSTLVLVFNSVALIFLASMILLVGYATNKCSRKAFLLAACGGMLICSYPLFQWLNTGEKWEVCSALLLFTLCLSCYIPSAFVLMLEAFPADVRFTGLSLGFNSGLAIFGGLSPLIATGLIAKSHNPIAPAYYLMITSIIAALASFFISDKRGQVI